MQPKMRYRLGIDLGTASIGWCMLRLDGEGQPVAAIRAGVRTFIDGRNANGASLAVTRRLARQMRRRRDRLLRRKQRMLDALVRHGFWPADAAKRKALASLDPYLLRAKGLDEPLSPEEFGRALFHLNQRRGFASNRKTDKKDNESGLLKSAISRLRSQLAESQSRTVGEWLARRHKDKLGVRARLRGLGAKDRAYELYVDRRMVADEFDALWAAQSARNPAFFTEDKRLELRDILLRQRSLLPVKPGRCTLIPEEPRAPLALPSVQRFRIYQELNNLRLVGAGRAESSLTTLQRDTLARLLEQGDLTFAKAVKALGLGGAARFNLEDAKRDRLKGNATSRELSKPDRFGSRWHEFDLATQDHITSRLIEEQNETALVSWLVAETGVDEPTAERIVTAGLPGGYGNLGSSAIARVLPELGREVITYSEAVSRAGFASHSALSHLQRTGEIMDRLPYYGEPLQRHVGFGSNEAADPPERRFGRIANPTVHIGLNELRKVVNALIDRYGHPAEVVVEVARELKMGREQRETEQKRQAERQKANAEYREKIAALRAIAPEQVRMSDIELMRLWVELNPQDALNRRCPYTGEQIGIEMLFTAEVEVDHILPFSMTLDDSLNNKVVCVRRANRDKGNRTPHDAFGHSPPGYDYEAMLQRAALMPREKARRFAADGYERWLREDKDFLARALTDTAYLSRIAREYLSLVCPSIWVIPGRLTAMLRAKFGLNEVLGLRGEKNRDDHRHHAVDAAVVAVTDRALLQRFAQASASASERRLGRLVEDMPLPWPTFREHVSRAVRNVIVSRRPDHGFEGGLHNDTAYGLLPGGRVVHRVMLDAFKSASEIEKKELADPALKDWLLARTAGLSGRAFAERVDEIRREHGLRRVRIVEKLDVIAITEPGQADRHGADAEGSPRAYKGYKGDSNYCIEVWRDEKGAWRGTVISTFEAHAIVRAHGGGAAGLKRLRHPTLAQNGRPLMMRLVNGDYVRLEIDGREPLMAVAKISGNGQVFMAEHREANVDARNRDNTDAFAYVSKYAGSLKAARARRVTVSPIGDLKDPGFRP
jgi:CRISPR-associated endonuclease Csn1